MLLALPLCLALAWADPLNPAPPEEAADRNEPFEEAFDVPAGDASALRGLSESAGFQSVTGAIRFGVAPGEGNPTASAATGSSPSERQPLRAQIGQSHALVVLVHDPGRRLAEAPRGRIGALNFTLRDDGAPPDVAPADDTWSATIREYPAGELLEILERNEVHASARVNVPAGEPYPTVIVTLDDEGYRVEGLDAAPAGGDLSLGSWLLGGLGLAGLGWFLGGSGNASRRRALRRRLHKLRGRH